jgi:hypothetical protein
MPRKPPLRGGFFLLRHGFVRRSRYYYLDDKIRFPFQAKCIAAQIVSPLRKGETVEVQRMAPEDARSADMLVLIRWHGRPLAVPLSQLVAIDPDQSSAEAIGDWH